MERQMKWFSKRQLIITMQCIVACLLGLEVAIPPNPYKMPLMDWMFKWKKGDDLRGK